MRVTRWHVPADRRVVVLTGASSGIGRAAAVAFARRGNRVVLAARSAESLERVAAECERVGGDALAVPCDVTEDGALDGVVRAALARFGRIDVWVGCASVYGYGSLEQMPRRSFRRILEVNLHAQIEGARAVLPHFRLRGRGTIVFVGSVFSRVAAPFLSAYITSKHGLLGFAESLRHELRRTGVTVSTVLPATVDTPIYQHAANYTGAEGWPMPPLVSPRRVAAAIVRRARRPKPITIVGAVQGSGWPLSLVARPLYGVIIRAGVRRLALRGSAPTTDGTLFEPKPEQNAVPGGWRTR